jgi:hypothetical protein
LNSIIKKTLTIGIAVLLSSCGQSEPSEPDLPKLADQWLTTIELDVDSAMKLVGKTKDYLITTVSSVTQVSEVKSLTLGEVIEGVEIGAIPCQFFSKDATYGNSQFIWRGRSGCMEGRSKHAILNAVDPEGGKRFSYIYISPISTP